MTVRTLDGQVVMQNKIYLGQVDVNLVENKPENSPKDSPSVHSKGSGSEAWKDKLKREYSALKPFAIISSSYLLFTITDGALRMIVLLHAYSLGFTVGPIALPRDVDQHV